MKRYILISVLLCASLVACRRATVTRATLVDVLAEMHLADAVMETQSSRFSKDSVGVYCSIFEKYGCTTEQLENTLAKYSANKEDADKLYKQVCVRLEKLQGEYADEVRELELRDSTNLQTQLKLNAKQLIVSDMIDASAPSKSADTLMPQPFEPITFFPADSVPLIFDSAATYRPPLPVFPRYDTAPAVYIYPLLHP